MGIFPMAENANSEQIFWVEPHHRGTFPLNHFLISHSLKKTLKQQKYTVTINHDFKSVMHACADRSDTWINPIILKAYQNLHERGYAHSVEIWQKNLLVGGVYGLCLGSAFFGESMFHKVRDMSKIALCYLVARLKAGGFTLFDTQFITPHLSSLGALEITQREYLAQLSMALLQKADFFKLQADAHPDEILQFINQTS